MHVVAQLAGCAAMLGIAACGGTDIVDPGTGVLYGTVSSEARGPMAGVELSVTPGGHSDTTDATGRFSVAGLSPGTYLVAFVQQPRGCELPDTVPVVVPASGSVQENLTVTCAPFAQIHGTVTGTRHGVLGSALVTVGDTSVRTGSDGRYEVGGLLAGSYEVVVSDLTPDCTSTSRQIALEAGDTMAVDWLANCRGPQLKFFRQTGTPGLYGAYGDEPEPRLVTAIPLTEEYISYFYPMEPLRRYVLSPDRSVALVVNVCGVYRADLATGAEAPMVEDCRVGYNSPAFSPSGRSIIMTESFNQGSYLASSAADGSGLTKIGYSYRGSSFAFAWRPDGRAGAFESSCIDSCAQAMVDSYNGHHHIWLMDPISTSLAREEMGAFVQLTDGDHDDIRPVWSPDGLAIAFLSDRDGAGFVPYQMGADGSGQRPLLGNTYWIWASGQLSPLGDELAYAAETDIDLVSGYGQSAIYVADADGSNPRLAVTDGGGEDFTPFWTW